MPADGELTKADLTPSERRVQLALQRKHQRRNIAAFWLMGFINNFHYCVVLSGAEAIAVRYHLKSYVALVSWANIFGGIFVRTLNAFVFTHIGYNYRCLVATSMTLFGIMLVSIAPYMGHSDPFRFFASLIGIFFIGNGSNYGESVMLGYLDGFHSMTISGWSSGTGLSGVAAALIYLGLDSVPGMTNSYIFLASLPAVALLWFSYFTLVVEIAPQTVRGLCERAGSSSNGGGGAAVETSMKRMSVDDTNAHAGADLYGGSSSGRLQDDGGHAPSADDAELDENVDPVLSPAEEAAVAAFVPVSNFRRPSWGHFTWSPPAAAAGATSEHTALVNNAGPGGDGKAERDGAAGCCDDDDDDSDAPSSCGGRLLSCLLPGVSLRALGLTHRIILFQVVNLMLVYVFEYGVQFLAPFAFPTDKHGGGSAATLTPTTPAPTPAMLGDVWGFDATNSPPTSHPHTAAPGVEYGYLTKNAFVLSQFCYQIGVLMSRSSLAVGRFRRVEVLTVLQGLNFICWIIQAKTLMIGSATDAEKQRGCTIGLLVWMVGVGLLGGASYVNVFYNILHDTDFPPDEEPEQQADVAADDTSSSVAVPQQSRSSHRPRRATRYKELAMNVGALYATMGVTLGSVLDVIISNTLL